MGKVNKMEFDLLYLIILMLMVILVSVLFYYIAKFLFKKFKSTSFFKSSKLFNPLEYFPEEQVYSLRQVFYLIMIVIFVINILYLIFSWNSYSLNLKILDILVSFYVAVQIDRTSLKNKILLFLLIPFNSVSFLLFNVEIFGLLDLIHSFIFFYFIKQYFDKFMEYSESNRLGITIMLLFLIVFISFLVTIIVENVSPLNSLLMVSNAFTSNGYAILGHSSFGKLNAIFLVWSGFLLSGVGTATLTVAIVVKHIDNKFDKLEDKIKKKKRIS